MGRLFRVVLIAAMVIMVFTACAIAEAAGETTPKIDLTPIVQAIISLLAMIITVKVIPWLKAKTTAQNQAVMLAAVKVAVFAAEQIYGSGFGDEKMNYVKQALAAKGYTIDQDAIEAAVRELSIAQGQTPKQLE